jgi:CSLREA domain-containing protein
MDLTTRRLAMKHSAFFYYLTGTALLLLCTGYTQAAIFNIADGDVTGLKNAINTANGNQQDDTINLATNGTYTLTTVDNTAFGPTGLPVLTDDSSNGTGPAHSLTINGNGATLQRSTAGGTPDFRILSVYNRFGGTITVNGLVIANGRATGTGQSALGGGILSSVSVAVQNCTLTGNYASQDGSAIYSGGSAEVLTIDNSTIANTPSFGGAAILNYGTVRINNSTLANNAGTAISSRETGNTFVTNCTFLEPQGAAIRLTAGAAATVAGTIFKSFYSFFIPQGDTGSVTSQGYNLSSNNGNGFLTNTGDQISTDPMLDPAGLQNNGGPTQTISLTNGSPAIDKGKSFGLTTDQRGKPRPLDGASIPNASGGDGSDIGAVEFEASQVNQTLIVNTTADHDDGTCGVVDCSLREAISAANAASGANTITFSSAVIGTITLGGSGELDVTDSTTIIGPGARVLAISGSSASRVFSFAANTTNAVSGLTIRDGVVPSILPGQSAAGAGIFNQGTLTLTDCTLSGNRVQGGGAILVGSGGSGNGGALYNSGVLTLSRCTLSGNSAGGGNGVNAGFRSGAGGGGGGNGGAIFNDTSGTLTLANCTFANNTGGGGTGGNGGGSFPAGGSGGPGRGGICNLGAISVTACTFNGNSGTGGNGGSGSPNGTPGRGSGGLTNSGGTAVVGDTISAGNTGNNGGGPDVDGGFNSGGYNLIGNASGSTGFSNGVNHDQIGANANLGPLQNYGGATDTMALLSGSLAINAGDPNAPAQDQRYYLRNGVPDIGAFESGNGVAPVSVGSRKTHGSAGSFNVSLPLTGPIGIECRTGGATNDHQLVLTFPVPVTVNNNPQAQITSGTGQVGSGGVSNGGQVSINGPTVTVPLTGVTNAQRITITLFNVSDGVNSNSALALPMGILLGDVNSTARTDAGDVTAVRNKTVTIPDQTTCRFDVNASGRIDAGDVTATRNATVTVLP